MGTLLRSPDHGDAVWSRWVRGHFSFLQGLAQGVYTDSLCRGFLERPNTCASDRQTAPQKSFATPETVSGGDNKLTLLGISRRIISLVPLTPPGLSAAFYLLHVNTLDVMFLPDCLSW
ncbi:hypothetical protein CGRA01v4_05908 [Colletotrichum graminicola]|nr:hypothetical protein CGRA01v4_05908 [Colletotrichum graminicola]